jgi:hypothetical protein
MVNNTSYSGIEVERRVGDHRNKVKYNTTIDDQGRRDYYSTLEMDTNSKKVQIGKSTNESKWNIRDIDGENETVSSAPFTSHSHRSELADFGIDAKDVFNTGSSSKKSPTEKKSPKEKKSVKKKSVKKKSVKKKSVKKKSANGGAKKKKISRKKSSNGGAKKKKKKKKTN